jgi:hypothetical protein
VSSSSGGSTQRGRGRLFLFVGLGLTVLGIGLYVAQIARGRLVVPWYMPALGLAGALFLVLSLIEQRTIWRGCAVVTVALLTGAELAFLFSVRLPSYTGPIAVGKPFPAFETARSDGVVFGQRDLTGEQNNVLVFFRGRW